MFVLIKFLFLSALWIIYTVGLLSACFWYETSQMSTDEYINNELPDHSARS